MKTSDSRPSEPDFNDALTVHEKICEVLSLVFLGTVKNFLAQDA
jgi:hypothetical protein